MAIIETGTASGQLFVDPQMEAARVSLRPPQADTGIFACSMASGVIAPTVAASSVLFGFRSSTTGITVVQSVFVSLVGTNTGAAGPVDLEMVIGRTFTASYTTNGTAASLSGNNNKKRTSYTTSNLAQAYIAGTAAITGATITLDTQGIGNLVGEEATTAGGAIIVPRTAIFGGYDNSVGPLVLAVNEGFVLRNPTAWPATGSIRLYVTVEWVECTTW